MRGEDPGTSGKGAMEDAVIQNRFLNACVNGIEGVVGQYGISARIGSSGKGNTDLKEG